MEKKLTRKEQAEATKELIFNTALEILDEKPFADITIRDIVKRANVSIGTFYNYYTTKLDVYYETYVIADEYFETTVREAVGKKKNSEEKILEFFNYYAKYNSEITDMALTSILYNSQNKCFDRESDIGMLALITEIIEVGLEKGEIVSTMSPRDTAKFFMVSVRGLVYNWCTNDGSYDLKKAMKNHVELLLKIFVK